jgi:hypothetical protein
MPDLADIHQALVEDYRESTETTLLLTQIHSCGVTISPLRQWPGCSCRSGRLS